ncbi:MAG: PIN domain-containing protein [Fimbriimonadales bacterium]
MPKRTYIDTSVLITAFRGFSEMAERAYRVLDDPQRRLVVSEAVRLEVLPKAVYNGHSEEVEFYQSVFNDSRTEILDWNLEVLKEAYSLAKEYGISAMDAIHIAHAIAAGVDEFVTCEKNTKPLFRVREIQTRSLRDEGV